jgi:hypothetical protein
MIVAVNESMKRVEPDESEVGHDRAVIMQGAKMYISNQCLLLLTELGLSATSFVSSISG